MSKRAKTFNQILPLQNKISSRGVQKAIAVAIGNFDKEIVKIVTNFLGCGWVCTPDRYRLMNFIRKTYNGWELTRSCVRVVMFN